MDMGNGIRIRLVVEIFGLSDQRSDNHECCQITLIIPVQVRYRVRNSILQTLPKLSSCSTNVTKFKLGIKYDFRCLLNRSKMKKV